MNTRTSRGRLAALALFGAFATCAPSAAALSLFDVIQMTQGGYEEDEIIRLLDVTGARFELDAAGLKALREADVPLAIIHRLLDDGGVAPDAYSTADAAALSMLLEAGFGEATILKFARHRQVCEPLDEEAAAQLADEGFTATFFDGLGELVTACQAARLARVPVEPALPPSAYAEQSAVSHHEPAQTAHTVIIREAPHWRDYHWRDHYYDRLHYQRYPAWYPVYIYRDHRVRDRHRHDRRHRWDRDRRHRGDRDRRYRDRGDHRRRRGNAVTETEEGNVLATRPPRREPWVSTRPAPLDGPSTRLLSVRSGRTATTPNETPAPVPRGRRTATVAADVADGPAPGALSRLPIKSASPRSISHAPRTAPPAPVRRATALPRQLTPAAPTVPLRDLRAMPVRRTVPAPAPRRPMATSPPRTAVAPAPRRVAPRDLQRNTIRRPAAVPRSVAAPRTVSPAVPSRIASPPRAVAPPRTVAPPRAVAPRTPPRMATPRPVAPRRDVAPRAPRRDEARAHR